jgi:hypothetical protein
MAVLVPQFSKNLDFDTPISKSAILVPLFCQILKLHTFLLSSNDVALFNIMWHLFIKKLLPCQIKLKNYVVFFTGFTGFLV